MTRKEKRELKKKKKETVKNRDARKEGYLEGTIDSENWIGSDRDLAFSLAILIHTIDTNSTTTNSLTNTIRWLTGALVVIGLVTIGLLAYTSFCI